MKLTKLEKFMLKIGFINAFITFIFIVSVAWYDYSLYENLIASHSVIYDVLIVYVITFGEILIYAKMLLKNTIQKVEVRNKS